MAIIENATVTEEEVKAILGVEDVFGVVDGYIYYTSSYKGVGNSIEKSATATMVATAKKLGIPTSSVTVKTFYGSTKELDAVKVSDLGKYSAEDFIDTVNDNRRRLKIERDSKKTEEQKAEEKAKRDANRARRLAEKEAKNK